MDVLLRIDNREQKLKTLLQDHLLDNQIICENLKCGDFIIEYDSNIIIIFERKTIKDLLASIKDGRYKIQKENMLNCIDHHKIMYIIEGSIKWNDNSDVDKKSIISSIINTLIRDKIHIVQTDDWQDTCHFLLQTFSRISKDPSKYMHLPNTNNQITTKEDFITKHKINNKNDMFFYQLTQVPGISSKTATAFVKEFDNMKDFYTRLLNLNDEDKKNTLQSIFIEDKGKKRRINQKVIDNILTFMFA